MSRIYLSQSNMIYGDDKKIVIPKTDNIPISASEKLVKEDIKKLIQNSEEIRRLKDQIERKKENKSD